MIEHAFISFLPVFWIYESLLSDFGLGVLIRVQASLLRDVIYVSALWAMVQLLLVILSVARSLSLYWYQLRSLPCFITPWLCMSQPIAYTDVIKNKSTHLPIVIISSPQGYLLFLKLEVSLAWCCLVIINHWLHYVSHLYSWVYYVIASLSLHFSIVHPIVNYSLCIFSRAEIIALLKFINHKIQESLKIILDIFSDLLFKCLIPILRELRNLWSDLLWKSSWNYKGPLVQKSLEREMNANVRIRSTYSDG